jgi:Flp pilus assembly protein TadG
MLRGFWRDRRGGLAVIMAIVVPAVLLIACGAVDLSSVRSDYSAMQDTADATALDAAKQLGIADNSGIAARAGLFAQAQIPEVAGQDQMVANTTFSSDGQSVTVTLSGHRNSFFGNLLPPGGWSINAHATAASMGRTPLCVLSSGTGSSDDIVLSGTPQVSAPNCLVQSNADIAVNGGSLLASTVQASGTASGDISPSPQVGAPAIADPFSSMNIKANGLLCNITGTLIYDLGVNTLSPGIYCGDLTVRNQAVVKLMPGEYYFVNSHLKMQQNSQLSGSNVVLVFDSKSDFQFADGSQIDLEGRTGSSPYAGFVIMTTRQNTGTFSISSTAAHTLVGTIYAPAATLAVSGAGNTVADQSAWTVVVAKAITLSGSPNLVINANYAGSTVPVPTGVGPNANKVKLVQ